MSLWLFFLLLCLVSGEVGCAVMIVALMLLGVIHR